jgi:hypothetical protein
MSPEMHGSTTSWPVFTVADLVAFAFIYLQGWHRLSKVRPREANI